MINVRFLRVLGPGSEWTMNNGSSKKTMLFGGFLCAGGITTTAMTYSGAASTAELSYVIAWGAIIFGFIQVVRGVVGVGPSNQG